MLSRRALVPGTLALLLTAGGTPVLAAEPITIGVQLPQSGERAAVGREQAERAGPRTRRRAASAGVGSSGSNRLLTAPRLLSYNTRAWQASHRATSGVS